MAIRVSISKLCRGCMSVLENPENSCPYCGFDKSNYPVDKKKLRVDFILKGKYLVGNAINATPYENTYIAWNLNEDNRVVVKEFLPSGLAIRDDYSTGSVSAISDETVSVFNKAIDAYVEKAKEIMAQDGDNQIIDVFRENGTAYYVMPSVEEDDHYRLRAFTYVDGHDIDRMVEQSRPKKPERVFVQPARSVTRPSVYPEYSEPAPVTQSVYSQEPQPYIPDRPRGNISAHVVLDNRVEYKPETVLPSLAESNREAKEREREKELEKKIEKRIEERLEKRLEQQMEERINKSNSVFSINPQWANGGVPSSTTTPVADVSVVDGTDANRDKGAARDAIPTKQESQSASATIQGDRRSAYTSIPPISTGAGSGMATEGKVSQGQYRGVINVNGRTFDGNQTAVGTQNNSNSAKKFDKTKLSEIKIAGKSLSTVASFAICAVIIILVITTLISKSGDDKNGQNSSVHAANPGTSAPTPTATVYPEGAKVQFNSPEFEEAVRKALKVPDEQEITEPFVASVETLNISNCGLTDVTDLAYFTGLKELDISRNKLNDINMLARLSGLKSLNIEGCKINDLSPLMGLEDLEYVNIVGNKIDDYTPVDNVKLVNGRYCKIYFTYVYHREDGDYDGYSLWSWHSGTIGGEHQFTPVPDGTVTATVEYYVPLEEVGFKIKYNDWEEDKDVDYDRWVKLNQNRYEEQITIHIYSDEERFEVIYSDGTSAEFGVKPTDKYKDN